jgi:hypothetical protein
MAFHQNIFDLAFFIAPALAVGLTSEEQADLDQMQDILQRREAELKLCSSPALRVRASFIKRDILDLQTAIADLRTAARYRRAR